jgi:phosphoribosylaminoimidazole carboxylase PurK protein
MGAETIGIVGGGQLGRMLTLAAKPLGFDVIVVDPSDDCPAAQVGAIQIKADLGDAQALKKLGKLSDVVTVEIEHLDADVLADLADSGLAVHPAPQTIKLIQDKFKQKQFLKIASIPVAPFIEITDRSSAEKAREQFGGQMLVKTRLNAYDGRGNMLVKNLEDLKAAFERFGETPLYAEAVVPFVKELAVMVARSTNGETALYPVVETIHERNICLEVRAPAEISPKAVKAAQAAARQTAEHLSGAGVFGIEMFLLEDDSVMINEIAPRVHNSGHYTTEACVTSQFEQHIRAVAGLPLGSTDMKCPAAVMVNILGAANHPTELQGRNKTLAVPEVALHWYGKSPTKVDRKMGHITATGPSLELACQRAHKAIRSIKV